MKKLPKIPPDQLKIIEECALAVSSANWIPGYDTEDIRQEAIIIGMKGLAKYNGKIPLDKYLLNHMRHRLRSLRREKYIKPGCDCGQCLKCSNNEARIKINSASEINEEDSQYSLEDLVEYQELLDYLDQSIPAELREDYLKVLAGVSIISARKHKLKLFIKDILDA